MPQIFYYILEWMLTEHECEGERNSLKKCTCESLARKQRTFELFWAYIRRYYPHHHKREKIFVCREKVIQFRVRAREEKSCLRTLRNFYIEENLKVFCKFFMSHHWKFMKYLQTKLFSKKAYTEGPSSCENNLINRKISCNNSSTKSR